VRDVLESISCASSPSLCVGRTQRPLGLRSGQHSVMHCLGGLKVPNTACWSSITTYWFYCAGVKHWKGPFPMYQWVCTHADSTESRAPSSCTPGLANAVCKTLKSLNHSSVHAYHRHTRTHSHLRNRTKPKMPQAVILRIS